MYLRSMKHVAVAFAGASAILLACTVKDNTTFQEPPPPTETTPPTRAVVSEAGVITLSGETGGSPPGLAGPGPTTPDAAEQPDAAPVVTASDAGGVGSSCDPLASTKNCSDVVPCNPNCMVKLQCDPNTDGSGTCRALGSVFETGFCDPTQQLDCNSGLVCVTNVCTSLCHYPATGDCIGSTGITCRQWGTPGNGIGYCAIN
jgi:hypothetical protein